MFGGRAAGIEVTNGGGGVIEENEVFDNHFDGICLATGVNPMLKGQHGALLYYLHVHVYITLYI